MNEPKFRHLDPVYGAIIALIVALVIGAGVVSGRLAPGSDASSTPPGPTASASPT
ncbi:MAG: hypothetical protein H0U86_02160 [Chloroflexi bacterium]|nr:hypothetical protein [Chloroflexota bacterium]